jgi:selenoprotein W-related protein
VADILDEFQTAIESIELVPSTGGVFEVSIDDELIFSKKKLERHAEPGEVIDIFRNIIA